MPNDNFLPNRKADSYEKSMNEKMKSAKTAVKDASDKGNASGKMKERLAGSKSVSKADFDRLSKSSTSKNSFRVRTPEQVTAEFGKTKKAALAKRIANMPKFRGGGGLFGGMLENMK